MDDKTTERALNAVISKALAVLNRYDYDLDFDLIDAERQRVRDCDLAAYLNEIYNDAKHLARL